MDQKKPMFEKWLMMAGIAMLAMGVYVHASTTSDNRIESTIKNTHVFKTFLKDDSIGVLSQAGVVTLSGTVSDQSHRELASETVESVAGVQKVHNNLTIKGEPLAENSDNWIATKVKTTLLFYRNVNGMSTQVDVKEGVVTLRGEADSLAQKDLTTEYANDIDGVKHVNNEMQVKSSKKPPETLGEKIDDASITAQVKMVLLYHRSTNSLKTMVKTVDGDVMLTGKAINAAEKDLVTKLVKDVHGVKDVINHMTIAPGK